MRRGLWGILAGAGLAACLAGCGAGGDGNAPADGADVQESGAAQTPADSMQDGTEPAAETEQMQEREQEPAENGMQGLGLSVVGDSISTYEGWIPEGFNGFYPENGELTDASQLWWQRLLKDTGMELCANNSSAGSTCAGDSDKEDIQSGCSSFRLSYTVGKQGRLPDIIIVYMGTNDLLESVPIGDNDGTALVEEGEIDNFSDAYCMMLDKLESEYPIARIYCCTLTQVGDWGTERPYEPMENSLGMTAKDYSERIRLIADTRGLPVIDLYDCGIEIDNLTEMTSDGVHLTPDGMKCVEEAALAVLESTAGE